jgi:hypothetical protein
MDIEHALFSFCLFFSAPKTEPKSNLASSVYCTQVFSHRTFGHPYITSIFSIRSWTLAFVFSVLPLDTKTVISGPRLGI